MRFLNLIFFTILSNLAFSQTTVPKDAIGKNEALVGEWIIDLRPSPEADPYLQSFKVSDQDGKNFTGLFYGSPIRETCLNTSWNKVYFAFKSSDGNNEYYQTGYIVGDKIFGVTYCSGRDFVMPWSGEKVKD